MVFSSISHRCLRGLMEIWTVYRRDPNAFLLSSEPKMQEKQSSCLATGSKYLKYCRVAALSQPQFNRHPHQNSIPRLTTTSIASPTFHPNPSSHVLLGACREALIDLIFIMSRPLRHGDGWWYFLVESEKKQSGMVRGRSRETNMRGLGDAGSERWGRTGTRDKCCQAEFLGR